MDPARASRYTAARSVKWRPLTVSSVKWRPLTTGRACDTLASVAGAPHGPAAPADC